MYGSDAYDEVYKKRVLGPKLCRYGRSGYGDLVASYLEEIANKEQGQKGDIIMRISKKLMRISLDVLAKVRPEPKIPLDL